MKIILLLVLSLFSLSCNEIAYSDDKEFISSGTANSPELPVTINATICKDSEGKIGACFLRIKADKSLSFVLPITTYNYTLDFQCTDALNANFKVDVLKDKPYQFTLPYTKYQSIAVFNCMGRIYPADRVEAISSFFEVRVRVINPVYVEREEVTQQQGYNVPGKNAYLTYVFKDGKYDRTLSKITAFEYKANETLYSESYMQRWNYYGI